MYLGAQVHLTTSYRMYDNLLNNTSSTEPFRRNILCSPGRHIVSVGQIRISRSLRGRRRSSA